MNDLPGYDAWKLATPPEYERDERDLTDTLVRCGNGCGKWTEAALSNRTEYGEHLCTACFAAHLAEERAA